MSLLAAYPAVLYRACGIQRVYPRATLLPFSLPRTVLRVCGGRGNGLRYNHVNLEVYVWIALPEHCVRYPLIIAGSIHNARHSSQSLSEKVLRLEILCASVPYILQLRRPLRSQPGDFRVLAVCAESANNTCKQAETTPEVATS